MPPPNMSHGKTGKQEVRNSRYCQGRRDVSPNGRDIAAWSARRGLCKGRCDWHRRNPHRLYETSDTMRMSETDDHGSADAAGEEEVINDCSSSSENSGSGKSRGEGQQRHTNMHRDVAEQPSRNDAGHASDDGLGATPLHNTPLCLTAPLPSPRRCHRRNPDNMSREGSTPASSTLCVSARLDDSQERCRRTAYDVSFHGDSRVKEHTTHISLQGVSFLLVERTVPGNNTGVYQRSRKVWEHIPIGQVRVFATVVNGSPRSSASNSSGGTAMVTTPGGSAPVTPVCVGCGAPPPRDGEKVTEVSWPRGGSAVAEGEDGDAAQWLRSSPTSCTTTAGYELVATLNGLRKFGHFDEVSATAPCQTASSRSWYAAQNGVITQAIALTRVDGESGQLTAFKHDGVRYWLVGCQERHVLVRLWVPDEDVMPYSEPGDGKLGLAKQDNARQTPRVSMSDARAATRTALAQRMALAWRHVLENDIGDAETVLRLHDVVCAGQWTLCFCLVSNDWEHLVDYWSPFTTKNTVTQVNELASAADTQSTDSVPDMRGGAYDEPDALRFFAITSHAHSSRGLCMPVMQALKFFDTYHLPRVEHSMEVGVNSAEYSTLRQKIATEINSAGAVFYGMNDQGDVVRLWKCRCYLYTLERAAQEAIVAHRLQGAALCSRLQKKLASLPRDVVRGCTVAWEQSRLDFLINFAGWLHRTRRLAASVDLAATRELRSHWVSTQQLYRATLCSALSSSTACHSPTKSDLSDHPAVASENDTSVSCNNQHEVDHTITTTVEDEDTAQSCSRIDVIMLVGPQGCGKSTLARTLYALLEQADYMPRWVNQDEVGNRRAYLAAISRAVSTGGGAPRVTHIILDKMNLNDDMRADYDALQLKVVLTVAWAHTQGMDALSEVCVGRVRARGNNHRTFKMHEQGLGTGGQHEQAGRWQPRGGFAGRTRSRSPSHEAGMTVERMERIVRSCVAQYELPCDPSLLQLDVTLSPGAVLERVWARLQERGLYELPPLTHLAVQAAFDTALHYERLLQQYPRRVATVVLRAVAPQAILALLPDTVRRETRLRRPELDEVSVTLHNFTQQPCPVALVHYARLVGTQCLVELQGVVADPFAALLVVRPRRPYTACASGEGGNDDRSRDCAYDKERLKDGDDGAGQTSVGLPTHRCALRRRKDDARAASGNDGESMCVNYAVVAGSKRANQAHYDDLAGHFTCDRSASDLYYNVIHFAAETYAPFMYHFTF